MRALNYFKLSEHARRTSHFLKTGEKLTVPYRWASDFRFFNKSS